MPIDDLKEHEASENCWCKPKTEGSVLIHNSMDEREKYEEGERLLS